MIQSDHRRSLLPIHCFLVLCLCFPFVSTQTCQNDIPDFFYNVSFAGPIFDQGVYILTASNFSVGASNGTRVFQFTVKARNDLTRPSFVPTTVTGRALNNVPDVIEVRSSDPSFRVVNNSNGNYDLVTNTYPLKYFSPYNRYLFNLIATQSYANRPPASSTAIVQLNLVNANVNSPVFIPPVQSFSISETARAGTMFGTVYATDPDNDTIIYSLSHGLFAINPGTGVLSLQQDFTTATAQYVVTVTATDDGSSCASNPPCAQRSSSIAITINVTAVNKVSPSFLNNVCGSNVSFREGNITGFNVTTLVVSDSDRGENGQITISFPSEQSRTTASGLRNTAYSQFYIEQLPQQNNTRIAYLKTNGTFDYDEPGSPRVWYLFILATDNGYPQRQSFCSLRVDLLDVNDNSPVFAMASWNYTIYRSLIGSPTSATARFLRIIAWDKDSGANGEIRYYIRNISVPYFTINETTGTIILQNSVPGVFSLNESIFPITFQVYAVDRGSPSRTSETNATVTIYFDNRSAAAPARWSDPAYEDLTIVIPEKFYERFQNRPLFSNVTSFNGTISYILASQTSSIMTVTSPFPSTVIPFSDVPVTRNGNVSSSGIVAISGLHAEIQNLYLVYIRVLVNPPLISTATIKILDENDQVPTFDIRSIVLSVVENESGNRVIAQVRAFDRDVDPANNFVQYELNRDLSDSEAIGNFYVNLDGTISTNTTFDRESNKTSYRIFIRAYDNSPAWNAIANESNKQDFQFDIQVIDVNDVPPVFINSTPITILIDETTAAGTNILNLTLTDTDVDTIIGFGISSGNINNVFTFTFLSDNSADTTRTQYRATGQLSVVGPLSYESRSNYTLVLFAFDTQNSANITVNVNLRDQNTKAPVFQFNRVENIYIFEINEGTAPVTFDTPAIVAIDPDINPTTIVYDIIEANNQYDISSVRLTPWNDVQLLNVVVPGLSRDLPFGTPMYNFSIRATDGNGSGVSSYAQVSIKVNDINNNGPIPINSPWILTEGAINASTRVIFVDYDDATLENTVPFRVQVINSPNFSISPTSGSGNFTLQYTGVLNRTQTKNLTVTFNATDNKGFSQVTTIPIIVGDVLNNYPISDGSKMINVVYVNGYMNSLINVPLGSVFVNDLDDWFRANRTYSTPSASNGQSFTAADGQLRSLSGLNPGTSTITVSVTKSTSGGSSSAVGTIDLNVNGVDSEYVRQASTIRIKGEYPETFIDPSLGNRLNTLRNALASVLLTTADSIIILAIRSVFQYRSPYYPPLPFDEAKQQALTDVVFYTVSMNRFDVENTINNNLASFASRFGINANASGPNPCLNYQCPSGTTQRPTRTIQPQPYAIDSNQTSFVGINVVDSCDCVNATYSPNISDTQTGCTTYSFNQLTSCPCSSVQSLAPVGPFCQVLGRTFNEGGGGYAAFDARLFFVRAPARFSFDFAIRPPVTDGLLLLYGRNNLPINDFFWTAIDIYQSRLRFQFRDTPLIANQTTLNASTWYHVEYQYVDSTILITINDCQYFTKIANDTLNSYDFSNVQLYLGGVPATGSLVSGLYPTLTQLNTFSGCIRNLQSNGYYLDMNAPVSSVHSAAGACPCELTNSCLGATAARAADVIIPWYTWLIIALVLLLLATIIALGLLTCIRRRQQQKTLAGLYPDDTRDNIIDYKETAGEEDHAAYNLGVLKKPVYALTDEEILANGGGGGRSGMQNLGYTDPIISRRPALGDYIDEKLTEHQTISYANDTQLHYRYEGEGSIASDLSSIDSNQFPDEHDYRFLYSWGPKFSRLADLYAGGLDDPDDDDIMNNA